LRDFELGGNNEKEKIKDGRKEREKKKTLGNSSLPKLFLDQMQMMHSL
jgi:hypothetical protein